MKNPTSKQANRQCRSGFLWAKSGNHSNLRLFSVILLCGFISAGSAWGQTRSATTSTSRTPTRTEKAADARNDKATDARTVKKAAETRSSEAKSESVRKEAVKRESDPQGRETQSQRGANDRSDATRDGGLQRRPDQQTEDQRVGRSTGSRVAPATRLSSGYRLAPGNSRIERNKFQLPDSRFRRDNERCGICFGVGFIFTYDRLHRLRCSHCYGRGFSLNYSSRLDDVCPICYGPVLAYEQQHRRSLQNCAGYVTDRLDQLLDLSRSQERKINKIIVDYLRESRYNDWFDLVVIRDRKIQRELSSRQRDRYIDFINNVDSRDLCDRCFDYF